MAPAEESQRALLHRGAAAAVDGESGFRPWPSLFQLLLVAALCYRRRRFRQRPRKRHRRSRRPIAKAAAKAPRRFLSGPFSRGAVTAGWARAAFNDLFFATCSCGRPRAFEPPLLLGDPAVLDGTSASGSGSGAAAAPTPAPKAYLATPAGTCVCILVCDNIPDNRLGRVQRCRTHRACLRTAGSVAFTLLSLQYRYSLSKK